MTDPLNLDQVNSGLLVVVNDGQTRQRAKILNVPQPGDHPDLTVAISRAGNADVLLTLRLDERTDPYSAPTGHGTAYQLTLDPDQTPDPAGYWGDPLPTGGNPS